MAEGPRGQKYLTNGGKFRVREPYWLPRREGEIDILKDGLVLECERLLISVKNLDLSWSRGKPTGLFKVEDWYKFLKELL